MKDIRLMQMERYLSEVGYATIQQLCEKFEIHPNTARSDIKELIERGVAERSTEESATPPRSCPRDTMSRGGRRTKKVKNP